MIDTPIVTQHAEQPTAVIRLTIPRAQIQHAMGPAHEELRRVLVEQGVTPSGPWFSHHLRMDPATFDFEAGVPVQAPIVPAGRVVNSLLPAARVARTTYRGGYEGLGAAWGEFETWLRDEGLRDAGSLWEVYAVGPESGPDPAQWRTEMYRPLA